MLRGAFGFVLLMACSIAAQPQQSHSQNGPRSEPSIDFSKDPCGNPLVESQGWFPVDGRVSRVLSRDEIFIVLPASASLVRVHIVGISREREAKAAIEHFVLNMQLRVLANKPPSAEKHPDEITGALYLNEGNGEDIGLALLQRGVVRFKPPSPYTMSNHQECLYRRAETDARTKKLGLWK